MRGKIEIASAGFVTVVFTAGNAFAGSIVVTAVPEPVSLSLLALGVGGLAVVRHLRRK